MSEGKSPRRLMERRKTEHDTSLPLAGTPPTSASPAAVIINKHLSEDDLVSYAAAHSEPIDHHHHVRAPSKIRVSPSFWSPSLILPTLSTFFDIDRLTSRPSRSRPQAQSLRTTSTRHYPSYRGRTSALTMTGMFIVFIVSVVVDISLPRVFCNRNLSLKNIKSYGFDMDYTLAVYNV